MNRPVAWTIWLMLLMACPIGLVVDSIAYPDVAPYPPPWPSDSPPERWAGGLLLGQACISPILAVSVMMLTRRWSVRTLAWFGILIVLAATALVALSVVMTKTGKYL